MADHIPELQSAEDFERLKQSSKLIVIDFNAEWCGPCKKIAPSVLKISQAVPTISFIAIDVEKFKDIAEFYSIQNMPTFVFLSDGQEMKDLRVVAADVNKLLASVKALLKTVVVENADGSAAANP